MLLLSTNWVVLLLCFVGAVESQHRPFGKPSYSSSHGGKSSNTPWWSVSPTHSTTNIRNDSPNPTFDLTSNSFLPTITSTQYRTPLHTTPSTEPIYFTVSSNNPISNSPSNIHGTSNPTESFIAPISAKPYGSAFSQPSLSPSLLPLPSIPDQITSLPNINTQTELPSGVSVESCLQSLGNKYTYGAIDSIGDGWCDDPYVNSGSSTLYNLNTASCGYDGGDCCIPACNFNSSIYECQITGFNCLNPQYQNLSRSSNFSIEVIATNYSLPLSIEESNAIFLLGLQYELIENDSSSVRQVTIISTVRSRFDTLLNHSVIVVDAIFTTYISLIGETQERLQLHTTVQLRDYFDNDDITSNTGNSIFPSVNALPGLERSVRLAATRANNPSLSFVVLCRNGEGLRQCLSRDQNETHEQQPHVLPLDSNNNLQCIKFAGDDWQRLYGHPTSFPAYASFIVTLLCTWGILGILCIHQALQLKFSSPKQGIIQQQRHRNTNNFTSNTTAANMDVSQIYFQVFLFWMITVLAILRTLYFLWLLLWPRTTTSSESYNKVESYIACREFYFLNVGNDFANTANASAAYLLILGWFYIFLVLTVNLMTDLEWQDYLHLLHTQQDQISSRHRDQMSINLCHAIRNGACKLQKISKVICFTCAFLIIIVCGFLWDYQHTIKRHVPITATITLLVVQSTCGLLLCAFFAPIQYHLFLLCETESAIRSKNFHKTFAITTAVMGILFLIGAHDSILTYPVTAFIWYSLFPRLLEITLVVLIIKRLCERSETIPSSSIFHLKSIDATNAQCKMIQAPQSSSMKPNLSITTTGLRREQHTSSGAQQPKQQLPESKRQTSNYKPIISDRFTDVESHLFPPWIQTWRISPYPENEPSITDQNQKLNGMIDTVSDIYLDEELFEQLQRMSESVHDKQLCSGGQGNYPPSPTTGNRRGDKTYKASTYSTF